MSRQRAYLVSAVLAAHVVDYWQPPLSTGQYADLFEDYVNDLDPYSPAEIERAFAVYGGPPGQPFFPRSGQLLAILRDGHHGGVQ